MADPSSIPPALSVEEWMQFGESKPFFDMLAAGKRPFGPTRRFTEEQKLHAIAALALHRHAAGFNHAELGAVESAAKMFERRRGPGDVALVSALRSLHRKVSALIPPSDIRIPIPE